MGSLGDTATAGPARGATGSRPETGGTRAGTLARRWWPLLAIVAVGLLLRLLVLLAPLPYGHHPDEPRNLDVAASMAREVSLDYDSFSGHMSYPGLMYNIGAVTFRSWAAARDLAGGEGSLARDPFEVQTAGNARSGNPSAVVAMRLPMLLLSVATIVLAAALAHRITGRRTIALLAAALVALSAVDVELGGTFTPDPATGALNTAVLLAVVWFMTRASLATHLAAGALLGLAVSAKYSDVLIAGAVVTAHVIRTAGRPWRDAGWLLAAAAASLAVFAVTSPMTFLQWDTAWAWIRAEQEHYRTGHPGAEGGVAAFYAGTLFRMFGPALVLVPFALALRSRERRLVLPIASFVVLYLAIHLLHVVRFERFMMALTGALAVLVALGWHGLQRRLPRMHRAVTAVAIASILLVPCGMTVATVVRAHEDPWSEAQSWIRQHVAPGTTIAVDTFGAWVDPEVYDVHAGLRLIDTPLTVHRARGVEFFISAAARYDGYDPDRYPDQAAAYRRLLAASCPEASFAGNNHTVTVFRFDRC